MALGYRKIQILAQALNVILENALLVAIITSTFLMSFGMTGVVKLEWSRANGFVLILLFLLSVNCAVGLIVGVGGLVGVYRESKQVVDRLKIHSALMSLGKTVGSRMEFKWRQRFYVSCSSIKIKLGQMNFLEELTPLNFLNTGVGLTVQMLLLSA